MKRMKKFFTTDLWRISNQKNQSWLRRFGYSILKSVVLTVRGFQSKDLAIRANGLTYSLTFAIVPILAMVVAIAKGFGYDAIIEERLNASFLGEMNIVPMVMGFVERYMDTAQGGVFLGAGLLVLFWAVYSFFRNVEMSFNQIWNVRQSRSVGRQLVNYISILFLVPMLIVVTSGLSIFLNTAATSASLTEVAFLRTFQKGFVRVISYVAVWLAFTWMYKAIPNTRVNVKSALVPGIIMGTLFQLLQALSVYILVFLSRTSIVYGAFASIPLLLMWLQWSCLLILIGAQMAYAIQNREEFDYEQDLNTMSRRYKDCVTLYLMSIIILRFNNDEAPLTALDLAKQQGLPVRLVNQLLSRLEEVGLVRAIYVEESEDRVYQPALDTHQITVGMVFARIDAQGTELFLQDTPQGFRSFWERFIRLKQEHNTLNDILLSEIE